MAPLYATSFNSAQSKKFALVGSVVGKFPAVALYKERAVWVAATTEVPQVVSQVDRALAIAPLAMASEPLT